MPLKLIGTIILLVIVTIFCGFNLEDVNKCDVNLVFYNFHNVPVFLTVLASFLAGIVIMLPFALFKKKMSKKEISQAAEKINEKEIKKAEKQKSLAEKAEKKAQHEEEKTIFDFKIRRPVEKKSAKPKEAVKDDSSVNSVPKPAAETDNAKTEK